MTPLVAHVQMDVACQLAEALWKLHNLTIIHRDLTVFNIVRSHSGVTKLADFGISRMCNSSLRISHGSKCAASHTRGSWNPVICFEQDVSWRNQGASLQMCKCEVAVSRTQSMTSMTVLLQTLRWSGIELC